MKSMLKNVIKNALRARGWAPLPPVLSPEGQRRAQLDQAVALFAQSMSHKDIKQFTFSAKANIIELADGRRYELDLSTRAGSMWSVPFTGNFEPDETAFVKANVKQGDIAIDVGANFGWFTLMLSQLVSQRGQVHAFEPVSETADLLHRNIELNGVKNVHMSAIALDAADATRDLYLPDVGISGSFVLHHYANDYKVQQVPTMTLDTYVKLHNLPRVDFIKADIEGAELNMLKGASQTLKAFRPTLLLEVQASSTRLFGHEPQAVFQFLAEHGYDASFLEARGKTSLIEPGQDIPQNAYNFVFAHPDRVQQSKAAA